MRYSTAEVKSGFLIITSIILLVGLTFLVGRYTTGPLHTYHIDFSYISGLEENAPVYYGGHEVGRVKRIEVIPHQERPIRVTVEVPSHVLLTEASEAHIDTLGLMGEKFVELSLNAADAPRIAPGGYVRGVDPIPMYLLVEKANLLADRMDRLTESLVPLVERLEHLTTGQEEQIAKTIANIHETSANLRDMTYELKFHPWKLIRKS